MHKLDQKFNAKHVPSAKIKIMLLELIILLSVSYLLVGSTFSYLVLLLINLLYVFASTYRLTLFLIGLRLSEAPLSNMQSCDISDKNLPTYTILVPLLKEAVVINQLKKALEALDYPKDKLQILLIIEEEDRETNAAIDQANFPNCFNKIIVPFSYPQTKAKACNYALEFATGDFTTIFDAEDRPEASQLKAVIQKFTQVSKQIVCVQCRLCFYNANENWLTKMFALEYAALFHYTLPAITKLSYPVPLGGTSNHIRTDVLRMLGGWDPYNVTEDAALGLKIALAGFATIMLESYTEEEAPITAMAWIRQRTRWIKGYLHTYLIYIQHPRLLLQEYKFGGFMFFHYLTFICPFLLIIAPPAAYFSFCLINEYNALGLAHQANLLMYLSIFNLGYGFTHLAYIAYKVKGQEFIPITWLWLTYPFYFILHVIAAIIALYKLVIEPHKWDKTEHGLSKISVNLCKLFIGLYCANMLQ